MITYHRGERLKNGLIFSIVIMLIPMVIATRLFSKTYLAPLYAVSFIVCGVILCAIEFECND